MERRRWGSGIWTIWAEQSVLCQPGIDSLFLGSKDKFHGLCVKGCRECMRHTSHHEYCAELRTVNVGTRTRTIQSIHTRFLATSLWKLLSCLFCIYSVCVQLKGLALTNSESLRNIHNSFARLVWLTLGKVLALTVNEVPEKGSTTQSIKSIKSRTRATTMENPKTAIISAAMSELTTPSMSWMAWEMGRSSWVRSHCPCRLRCVNLLERRWLHDWRLARYCSPCHSTENRKVRSLLFDCVTHHSQALVQDIQSLRFASA
jgi:hypothetical protein